MRCVVHSGFVLATIHDVRLLRFAAALHEHKRIAVAALDLGQIPRADYSQF